MVADTNAVVVSNDNFRELINEKPEYKKVIEGGANPHVLFRQR
jgi:hypothetical protein